MSIPQLEPGTAFADEFRVVRALSSAVYVVEQGSSGSQRALKLMDSELVSPPAAGPEHARLCQRFEQAAYAGARIESDHVVQVLGAGVSAGTPWLAMELLRGEDLATRIAARGPEPRMTAREIVAQLSHALGAAHAVGIVHQDLRPESLFLAVGRREGTPFTLKVLGFGVAELVVQAGRATGLTPQPWRAPELEPGRVAAPAADVWALGLIAYFVLTGRVFWRSAASGSASAALSREIAFEPLPRASERAAEVGVASLLPAGFDAWFGRCVARDPSARFANVHEARAGFDAILGLAALAPSAPAPSVAPEIPNAPAGALGPSGTELESPAFVQQAAGSPFRHPAPGWAPPPRAPARNTAPLVALGLAALLVLPLGGGAVGFVAYRHSRKTAQRVAEQAALGAPWSDADSPVPVTSRDPSWGARDAPVTVVEFSDFQCPFCARAETTMGALRERYGPEQLRIVWKNQPLSFHANAMPAAEAAEVVFQRNGKLAFWDFHHRAFENQRSLGSASYRTWATDLGLDGPSYAVALEARQGRAKVEEDQRLAGKVGAVGTPTFFVNGLLLSGAQPIEKFAQLVDQELGKAGVKLASGTRKDRLYVELSQANFVEPKQRETPPRTPPPAEDGTTVHKVPVGSSPTLGPATAAVTIVVFSDYQCPFCKRAEGTLKELRQTYGKQLRIVWKDHPLPFHQRAVPAANLALEARRQRGDAAFWKTHDLLMESKSLEDTDLRRIAEEAGLDVAKAMSAVAKKATTVTDDDDALLATRLHVSGTPRFFINGRSLTGAQPVESFKKVIDEELAHAERLVREGVRPEGVYQAILASAVDEGTKGDAVVKSELVVGDGLAAESGDKVRVHYVGSLPTGKEFDSSRTRGQPFEFELGAGHVIKGWDDGVVGMRVGGKRRLTIPASLAYGERGHPPAIPANATLVFVVELLEVTPKPRR